MNKLIKIDRVGSMEEAKQLEGLGVSMMSISLTNDSRFQDQRNLSEREAHTIKAALDKRTKLVAEIPLYGQFTNWLDVMSRVGFDYMQPIEQGSLSPDKRVALRQSGIGLIYSFLQATYDDDPSWIFGDFSEEEMASIDYFCVDLLPDMEDSWRFFIEECPKYPNELQLSDINLLAENNPMLVSIDFSKQNVNEVFNLIPSIKGINLVLADDPDCYDIHCFNYEEVLDILSILKLG